MQNSTKDTGEKIFTYQVIFQLVDVRNFWVTLDGHILLKVREANVLSHSERTVFMERILRITATVHPRKESPTVTITPTKPQPKASGTNRDHTEKIIFFQ
jgi:hypothetical protein